MSRVFLILLTAVSNVVYSIDCLLHVTHVLLRGPMQATIPYRWKIWQELKLVDWPQSVRIKYWRILIRRMAEFDLATP